MTNKEFSAIQTELKKLSRALSNAFHYILDQETEIRALRSVLEQRELVSGKELDMARNEAIREVRELLVWANTGNSRRAWQKPPFQVAEVKCIRSRVSQKDRRIAN